MISSIIIDSLNRIISVVDAQNNITGYSYDAVGNKITETDANNHSSTYSYDLSNRQVAGTDAGGSTSRFEYDAVGNQIKSITPINEKTAYTFDALNRRTTIIDPLTNKTSYQYDALSNETTVTSPKLENTVNKYDDLNRRIEVKEATDKVTGYVFDPVGNQEQVISPRAGVTKQIFDGLNRVITKIGPAPNNKTSNYTYDAVGNKISKTKIGQSENRTISFAYDSMSRLNAVTDNSNATVKYEYDAKGNKTKQYKELLYDFNDGNSTGWAAAAGNWQVEASEYSQSNIANSNTNVYYALPQSGATTYEWTAKYITGVKAGMHIFASSGSSTNRGTSYLIMQDTNSTVGIYKSINNNIYLKASFIVPYASEGETHAYRVNYDPRTGVIKFFLDNQYISGWTDANPLTNGSYISWRTDSSHVHFDDLKVTSEPTYYTYDNLNRQVKIVESTGRVKKYNPDAVGNPVEIYDISGNYSYVYDSNNRVTKMIDPDGKITNYIYNSNGQRSKTTQANNIVTDYGYDNSGRLTSIKAGNASSPTALFEYLYGYDANSNIISEALTGGGTVNYGYDVRKQLTSWTSSTNSATYTYDANGNLKTETIPGVGTTTYSYDLMDELTSYTGPSGNFTFTGQVLIFL